LPYQAKWVADKSRLNIALWSRQSGKSFGATFRAVRSCVKNKTTWIFLSKGERQSRLLMEKVKAHLEAVTKIKDWIETDFLLESEDEDGRTRVKQLEARLENGSVMYGLPANPDTARGYSGNVTLDEFAFHKDSRKIYSALYPSIMRGFTLEVISTANGTQGKFYDIAKEAGLVPGYVRQADCYWSAHLVDIYYACMEGLADTIPPPPPPPQSWIEWARRQFAQRYERPATERMINFVAALRAGEDDEESWQQEFECLFLSDAANYIPMELVLGCVSEAASTDTPPDLLSGKELYLGIDIGRKRDLTVAWLFEKLGDTLWSRVLLTMKGRTFDAQETAICDLIEGTAPNSQVRRCAVDESGLGMMLAERLAKKYGALVEPVTFTAQVKERLAPMVKKAFEDRTVRIPDNREVRSDMNAVKRFVTPAGNIRFDAEHTDKGHADRFWALALALNAAEGPQLSTDIHKSRITPAHTQLGSY
jgi:phage FluMu gp28-like protein